MIGVHLNFLELTPTILVLSDMGRGGGTKSPTTSQSTQDNGKNMCQSALDNYYSFKVRGWEGGEGEVFRGVGEGVNCYGTLCVYE